MKERFRVLVALCLGVFFVFCFFIRPTRHSRSDNQYFYRAKGDARRIVTSIKAYHMIKSDFPVAEQSNHKDYISFLFMTLVNEKFLEIPYSATNSYVLLDPWDSPYNVAIRGITMPDDAYKKTFGKINSEVIAWSSGENKMNEYGKGDDILEPDSKTEVQGGGHISRDQ